MKRLCILLLCPVLFTPYLKAAVEPTEVDSSITAVTVYSDRARVTREASLKIPGGETILQVNGLPFQIDDSSVQVSGEGAATILGIEVRRHFGEKENNPEVEQLQKQLEALTNRIQKFSDEERLIAERETFLNKMRESLTRQTGKDMQTSQFQLSQVKGLYDFYSASIQECSERKFEISLQKRELDPQIQKLRQELNRLKAKSGKREKRVLISLKSKRSTTARLAISYVIHGASWQPIYNARTFVEDEKVELTYQAMVRQQTGEDWNDVKLSLSTARPQVGGRMPDIDPWFLRKGGVYRGGMLSKAMGGAARDQMANSMVLEDAVELEESSLMQASSPEPKRKLSVASAHIESKGTAMVFEVKAPATIPSDGEPQKTTLLVKDFKGDFSYTTTPKLGENAYLTAELKNDSGAAILGGRVNLFLEDDFVGTSYVNFIAPSADFKFYLGVDDDIKVKRKEVVNKKEVSGMIRKSTLNVLKYQISVENFKKSGQKITVVDQLPVSRDSSIEVAREKFDPKPTERDDESGKLTWTFDLKPREKKEIEFGFEVSWPQGENISGL